MNSPAKNITDFYKKRSNNVRDIVKQLPRFTQLIILHSTDWVIKGVHFFTNLIDSWGIWD